MSEPPEILSRTDVENAIKTVTSEFEVAKVPQHFQTFRDKLTKDYRIGLMQQYIINSKCQGEYMLIPRIPKIPPYLHSTFKRQFSVLLHFSMTIYKHQEELLRLFWIKFMLLCWLYTVYRSYYSIYK